MKEKKQRLFFALVPDRTTSDYRRLSLCRSALAPVGKPVPQNNLHITLAFLGNVAPATRCALECEAAKLAGTPSVILSLDTLGYWSRSHIAWLGASTIPPDLFALAGQLSKAAMGCGLRQDRRPYFPHITLAKSVYQRPSQPPLESPLIFHFHRFGLYISEPAPHHCGVRYTCLADWPLTP